MQLPPPSTTFVVIDGIIGAGKTTLVDALSRTPGRILLPEPAAADANPYLEDFYRVLAGERPNRGEPTLMQLHLLFQRYQAQTVIGNLSQTVVLQDRCLWADKIFADLNHEFGTIPDREYALYLRFFNHFSELSFFPSLVLFLAVDPEIAWKRIEERRRGNEQSMPLSYLQALAEKYESLIEWFESRTTMLRIPYNTPRFSESTVAQIEAIITEHRLIRQQTLIK